MMRMTKLVLMQVLLLVLPVLVFAGSVPDTLTVRAVRGNQSGTSLIDNGNGTVTDTETGLMWQKATAPILGVTDVEPQQVGTLHVVIAPQQAVDDGAQWRVDGGVWRNSGTYIGLEVGSHTVNFKAIPDWFAPPDNVVDIIENQVTEITGTYSQETGALAVTITPQGAVDAGAQWNADSGDWQDSGTTVSGLAPGDHTVNYMAVAGWNAPPSDTVTIVGGVVTEITGTYTQQFGSLRVFIAPQSAIDEGAKWRIESGGLWHNSGDVVSGLGVGEQTVIFKGTFRWNRPDDQLVTVYENQVTEITGTYTELTGGNTIRVPADYTTIQAAINAASDADIVLVADGTYAGLWNTNLDFNGKAIKVSSENGPEGCIIDCVGNVRGFRFDNGEKGDSVVSGFTVTNGEEESGGGIYMIDTSPTITNCTISGNRAFMGDGGGIFLLNSSPTITNCTLSGNSAGIDNGGGISSRGSSPTITNCNIYGNGAETGGGIFLSNSSPTITNCTISGNGAFVGGGIYSRGSSPTITNSIFWDEVFLLDGAITINYSVIQGGYTGEGNIDADPLFVDPANRNYHLRVGSPCINAGTSDGAPLTDLDGTPRPQGSGYDMGAYEFVAKAMPYIPLLLLQNN